MVMMACCIEWRMCWILVWDFLPLLPPHWFCDLEWMMMEYSPACLHGGTGWWMMTTSCKGERGSNYYFMQHRNVVFANDSRTESKRSWRDVLLNLSTIITQQVGWCWACRTRWPRDLVCILKSALNAYRYWAEIVCAQQLMIFNLRDELTTYGFLSTLDNYTVSEWMND